MEGGLSFDRKKVPDRLEGMAAVEPVQEYFGHHASDGSGDVFFHLDTLWSDTNINFFGIDDDTPLSDWGDGFDHADAALAPAIDDQTYLQSNITGREGLRLVLCQRS